MRKFMLSALFVLALGAHSVLAFEIGGLGVFNFSSPSADSNGSSITSSSRLGFGFGGIINFSLLPSFGSVDLLDLEIGVFYLPRKYSQTSAGGTKTDFSASWLQFPLLVRLNPVPFLTLGAGGYFAFAMSDMNRDDTSVPFDQVGLGRTDLGLLASVGLRFPVAPTLNILAEGRYLIGLANLAKNSSDNFKFRDFQLLGGAVLHF